MATVEHSSSLLVPAIEHKLLLAGVPWRASRSWGRMKFFDKPPEQRRDLGAGSRRVKRAEDLVFEFGIAALLEKADNRGEIIEGVRVVTVGPQFFQGKFHGRQFVYLDKKLEPADRNVLVRVTLQVVKHVVAR
jgi:hypothetical protein